MIKTRIILLAVFCFVFLACEKRELVATNDFSLKVTSNKPEIDSRTASNTDEDNSLAIFTLKATSTGIRDELPIKVKERFI